MGAYRSETGAPGDEVPQAGGTLIRRLEADVSSLNFVLVTNSSEKEVLSYLHDSIVGLDENLNVVPAIATKWQITPDGKKFTFTLDPKATFSDGRPVRASDVVFTLRKIADPKSESVQLAGLFSELDPQGTRALDDSTVEVVFRQAHPSQLYSFNIPVLPEHVYSKGNFKNDYNETVVGTGPYKLTRREPGKQIILERRPDYRGRHPYIQTVIFRIIEDDGVAWNALKTGQIDEARIGADTLALEGSSPDVRRTIDVHRFYFLGYNFIPWNGKDPLLGDRNIRRALAMCLDRPSIIRNLFHGSARALTGPFTPDQWAYDPKVKPIEFDLAKAGQSLEELGWKDSNGNGVRDKGGRELEFEILLPAGSKSSANQAQVFQAGLKQAGVKANLTPVDGATYFERITAGKFQSSFLRWDTDIDPDPYSLFHSSQFPPNGQNFVFYSNPDADRLIEAGRRELDFARRRDIYHQLHALLAADQPYTWTFQVSSSWAINRRIRNVKISKGLCLFLWDPGPRDWWIPAAQRRHETPAAPATTAQ